MNVGV
ncbi:hypothetical protein D041_0587A, partial [Vibrio parahaemolyticus EKP-008]